MQVDFKVEEVVLSVAGEPTLTLRCGKGDPVVILASTLVIARSYSSTILELAARGYRVAVVEAPGSGSGQRNGVRWSVEAYACWCEALFQSLELRNATLIAHSSSGPFAIRSALRAPRLIARLILADSVGADAARSMVKIIAGRVWDAGLELWLSITRWHHVVRNVIWHWTNFWHQVGMCARIDVTPEAARIVQPVLLAWGGRDHTTPLRCMKRFQQAISAPKTYISLEGSHDWLITHASEFADHAAKFIQAT